MRATIAVSAVLRAYAIAFGLSLAILGMGVGLAHAGQNQAAAQTQVATGKPADQGFVCHAQPGSWCDLRDWSQYGGPKQPTQSGQESQQSPTLWE